MARQRSPARRSAECKRDSLHVGLQEFDLEHTKEPPQWAVMQQALSAEIRAAFADRPDLLQMVHARMAYWLGILQSSGDAPEARH
jgi:hypothetical protein